MHGSPIETDVIVIGAGPSGLFAVFECGMLGLNCAVFDSLADIGGQCTALYPEKPIYDIPACPEISAGDLIANLEKQALPFGATYHLDQQIVSLSYQNGFWHVLSSKGIAAKAGAIIIAAGAGAFGPNRPPLEGIEHYENYSVFYMVRRRENFAGKTIVIAGGGDSAIDWALNLAPLASKIYIVHRRDKFKAAPESLRRIDDHIAAGRIELVTPYQLSSLQGADQTLTHVVVQSLEGQVKTIEADILLPFFGLAHDLGPIKEWGLSLDKNHILVDPSTCETNVKGIYAIGDIAAYKNKLKLILTGFNEAALAAHAIQRQLQPDQELHFEYSTTKGLPGAV